MFKIYNFFFIRNKRKKDNMYKIYGVSLFIILLLLIYLLNRKNDININIEEGFTTINDYVFLNKTVFNSSFSNENRVDPLATVEEILDSDSVKNDKLCLGITIPFDYNSNNNNQKVGLYYKIYDTENCYSSLVGSGEQRNNALNYKTYIKKNVYNGNRQCLTEDDLSNSFFTIQNTNDMYLCIDSNNNLVSLNKFKIQLDNLYDNTKFKIVSGLYGRGNISITFTTKNGDILYLTHNFPSSKQLSFQKRSSDDSIDVKKRSSFRLVSGLSKNGFSIKLFGITDTYIKLMGKNTKSDSVIVDRIILNYSSYNGIPTSNPKDVAINQDTIKKELASFKFAPELIITETSPSSTSQPGKYIPNYDLLDEENAEEIKKISKVSKEEKVRLLKNKNINYLDKQSMILENQNNRIKDMENLHFANISKIGREFANQSARLALSKYIKEKDDIEVLKKTGVSPVDSMPSVESFRSF